MVKFISEISSNHNGSLLRARRMIKLSKDLGFDIVKFQLFKIEELFSKEILKPLSHFYIMFRYRILIS